MHTSTPKVLCFAVLSLLAASSLVAKPDPSDSAPWTFVSIPDFLNFDIEYLPERLGRRSWVYCGFNEERKPCFCDGGG